MKKISLLITVTLISAVCIKFIPGKQKLKQESRKEHSGNRLEPNERMLLERSYPDEQFDFVAYQKAHLSAYKTNLQNQLKSPTTLNWNVEGPGNPGGRFNCVDVNPNNPNIIYAGAAAGGVFITTDGGASWNPIFDSQPFLAIGCIAIDPNNTSTIWVGTGDPNIGGYTYIGDGIYKSVDGGNTWMNMGLNNQYIFSKIIVDPSNSSIIYAATMGQPFARDANRGLYKSVNGGVSWTQILFVSNDAGIIDMVINPNNPQVLYAASYNRISSSTESVSYGNQSKIWKTTNGGSTWSPLTNGLPNFAVSRIGLTIYPSDPDILYTSIGDSTNLMQGIYKTMDAGNTWSPLGSINNAPYFDGSYWHAAWFFGKIYVNPSNPNQIYVLGIRTWTTSDNGATWEQPISPWVHTDHHFMHFIDGQTILLCTDGGIYKTTDNWVNFTDIENIPVNRVYHAIENPFIIEDYWCGVQDNGTYNGNSLIINDWQKEIGGDGFQMWFDPTDANIVYGELQDGEIRYTTTGTGNFSSCAMPNYADRRNWDMPYIISKFDHTKLYTGTYKVYKMTGAPTGTWDSISGDLTDGLGTSGSHTITTISESSLSQGKIYVGTTDANVWVTTNDGINWNNITGTLPERYVTSVKASPNFANNVYVSHSGYRSNENIAHIHKSINNGTYWTDISGDLPPVAVNDILINQGNENNLYVATDAGVYYTINAGINWFRLGSNMPMIPVFDVEFNTAHTKIIASTFARSVQTIDITGITGIPENSETANSISIFPNPASDYLQISLNETSDIQYKIYSLTGDEVKSGKGNSANLFSISLNEIAKGTYIIQIETGNKKLTQRFVKM